MARKIFSISEEARRLKKPLRLSGIEAYKRGYNLARATQADPVLMKTIIDRLNRQMGPNGLINWSY